MKTLNTLLALSALAAPAIVTAADSVPVSLSNPIEFTGIGCDTPDSIKTTGENTDTLAVMFEAYDVGVDAASGTSSRAACDFTIPVRVSPGHQISALTVEWSGFAQGAVRLKRQYIFTVKPNDPLATTSMLNTKSEGENYQEQDTMPESMLSASTCGNSINLQVSSSILAKTETSYIAVDTANRNNKVTFNVQSRACD